MQSDATLIGQEIAGPDGDSTMRSSLLLHSSSFLLFDWEQITCRRRGSRAARGDQSLRWNVCSRHDAFLAADEKRKCRWHGVEWKPPECGAGKTRPVPQSGRAARQSTSMSWMRIPVELDCRTERRKLAANPTQVRVQCPASRFLLSGVRFSPVIQCGAVM
jgi:hypothetical protein